MSPKYLLIMFSVLLIFPCTSLLPQDLFDEPVFSKQRGFYEDSFTLEITYNTPDAVIKYTKDGTNPFTSPTAKDQPSPATITIDPMDTQDRDHAPGVIIKACAVKDGILLSKVATHTYLFVNRIVELSPDAQKPGPAWPDTGYGTHPSPPSLFVIQGMNYGMDPEVMNDPRYKDKIKDALLSIPSISFVTDLNNLFNPDSGIYVNPLWDSRTWERRTSVELLNPDGSNGFQIDAGLRIRGAWGRSGTNFKHSFRLFFRKEYGNEKLKFPLFGDEGVSEFDNVDLRCSQNYSWAYPYGGDGSHYTELREVFSRDTQRDMGQPYTRSRYYHLYINGTYWGLYQTQERAEAAFGRSYLGGIKEDYDVIKVNVDSLVVSNYHIDATDGNLDAYQKLWEIAVNGFKTDESYYKVQGLNPDGSRNPEYPVLVDIDNLIDYILCYFYVADPDGPVAGNVPNNFYAMINKNADRGFVFFRHDAEHSLFSNSDMTGLNGTGREFRHFNPRWLHQQLCDHPGYRLKFYDHVYKHFFNNGALTFQACKNRLLTRKEQMEDAVITESARWGDAYSYIPHTKDDTWLPEVNLILDNFFPNRTNIVLQQLKNRGLYPPFEPPSFDLSDGKVPKGTVLTMNSPEGSIYYTTDGNDTHSLVSLKGSKVLLVPRDAEKRVLVPATAVDVKWRYSTGFDDSSWLLCNNSPGTIGFDLGTTYKDQISFNIENQMYNKNSTCLIRIPFEVTKEQLNDFNYLTLKVQYDDGFVAYLNKSSAILSKNAPTSISWNTAAKTSHEGQTVEYFDITTRLSSLVEGTNLLAIQALNVSSSDPDFFISVELVAGNIMKSSGPISPSSIAYTSPITIDHTTKIKARVYKDDQWSALNEITLWVPEGNENLRITELNYHPLPESDTDEKEFEFIELKNIGNETLDLSGLTFTQGIEYTFPSGTVMNSGAHLVLASNSQMFETRYKFAPFAEYNGQLGNAGDTLVLKTGDGNAVFDFIYKDSYPWPNSPDGLGYSLICMPGRLYKDQNDPKNWCASKDINGNPGYDDEVTGTEVKEKEYPKEFRLFQNYPNPFNPVTIISYNLASLNHVDLRVYDILGREVAVLVNGEQNAGRYQIKFDGSHLASGVYLYRIHISAPLQSTSFRVERKEDIIKAQKMVLLR